MTKQLKLTVLGDSTSAQRAMAGVQSQATQFTGALAGVGKGSKNPWAGLAAAISGSGLSSEFGTITDGLAGISTGLDNLYDRSRRKINVGGAITGIGVTAAVLGGAGEALSSPLEAAQAQLKQSVANAGADWSQVQKPVDQTQKKMQNLGFTYKDTDEALARLTQGLGSPTKAIQESGLVADIAARNHTSLADAAILVTKAYAGSTRMLKQFGINTADSTKAGKAAVSAQKNQAKANTDLEKAQQHLTDLQQRLSASGTSSDSKASKQRQSNAAAVLAAQDQLAAAAQHLQDVQASLATGKTAPAQAQSQLEAAQNRVAAAQKKLNDAQSKSVTVTGLSVSQQQELAAAQQAVADAQAKKVAADQQAVSTQGDLNKANLSGQQILDMLKKKTHGLAQAQASTFGGDLRRWKAQVIDFGATFGEHYAKPLLEIGPTFAALGGLIQSQFFKKITDGLTGAVKGIGSLGKSLGGSIGIIKPSAATATPGVVGKAAQAGSAAEAAGPLDSAATQLQEAAAALERVAASLGGAAADEAGAATGLDESSTGLKTSAGDLEGSATGLDESATALKGSAAPEAAAVPRAAAAPALPFLSNPVTGTAAILALAGYGIYAGATKHGFAVQGPNGLASGPGAAYLPAPTYGLDTGQLSKLSNLSGVAAFTGGRGFASGGVVAARPGGRLVNVAEGGEDEIIGSAPTIVAALQAALGTGAGRSGPDVGHYRWGHNITIGQMTVRASDPRELIAQLAQHTRRANFSGAGTGAPDL